MNRIIIIMIAFMLTVSPTILTTSLGLTIEKTTPGAVISHKVIQGRIVDLDWSTRTGLIAFALAESREVDLFDSNLVVVKRINLTSNPVSVAWRPGTDWLAIGTNEDLILVDVTGRVIKKVTFNQTVRDLSWSTDGKRLAVALENGFLAVYLATYDSLLKFNINNYNISAIEWLGLNKLLWGDVKGIIGVYDYIAQENSLVVNLSSDPIVDIKLKPNGQVVAVATHHHTYLLNTSPSINVVWKVDFGSSGNIAWDPEGFTIAVPTEKEGLIIIANNGTIIKRISSAVAPQYRYTIWDPKNYTRLLVAEYNEANNNTFIKVIYSAASVTILSKAPVKEVCYNGVCSESLTIYPTNQTDSILLKINCENLENVVLTATIKAKIKVYPFERITIDPLKLIESESNLELTEPSNKALVVVLRNNQTRISIQSNGKTTNTSSDIIVLDPGFYNVKVYYLTPANYLGPESILSRTETIWLNAGEVEVLDFSDFKLEDLIAFISLSTEPSSLLILQYNNTLTNMTVVTGNEILMIPAGVSKLTIRLPMENAIVETDSILTKTVNIELYPGETIVVKFHYYDVAGKLVIRAPPRTTITIIPPWASILKQVQYDLIIEEENLELWMQPGTYMMTVNIEFPDNYLGPRVDSIETQKTIERGSQEYLDVYSLDNVGVVYNQFREAATLKLDGSYLDKNYVLVIKDLTRNTTLAGEIGPDYILTYLVAPGKYRIDIVDPKARVVVLEISVTALPKHNYTIPLKLEQENEVSTNTGNYAPPPERMNLKKIAGIAAIVLISIIISIIIYRLYQRRSTPL